MQISSNGIKLIQSFEGCELTAYRDPAGVLTIGWGHTKGVTEGETITQTEANNLLKGDLKDFVDGVNSLVKVNLNQNQFDALVSFAYNVGLSALESSTLLSLLNHGDYKGAANEFPKWNHAGGEVLDGLTKRRLAEQTLFLKAVPKPATRPYTVSKGENLTLIANRFSVSVNKLIGLNPDLKANPNLIYPGQVIQVPNTVPKPKPQTVPPSVKYVVREGENLTVIANRLGVPLSDVLRLNPQIKNPNYVLIGQVINVPNN